MGGINIWQLAIIAVIVILLFGTKKLRNVGSDLGSAVKGFKKSLSDDSDDNTDTETTAKSTEALAEKTTQETATNKEKDQV